MDDWEDDDVQIGIADRDIEGQAQNDEPGPAEKGTGEGGAAGIVTKTRKKGKPRPKLTLDLLKEPQGINDVFCKFPDTMRSQFKGKGHEVGDLQRLLELYARWQQRIFPHCKFDDFIVKLEKLGSSAIVKNELRELRQGLVKLLAEEQQEGEQADGQDLDAPAAAAAPQVPPQHARAGGMPTGQGQTHGTAGNPHGVPSSVPGPHFPDEDDAGPPMEDELMNEVDALEAMQEELWANAFEAVPDLDEQLFEEPAPRAPPAVPPAEGRVVSGRDTDQPAMSAHDAAGPALGVSAPGTSGEQALTVDQGEGAGGLQQQQEQQRGDPMQEDLMPVPVAAVHEKEEGNDEEDMDDDELLRQAIVKDG